MDRPINTACSPSPDRLFSPARVVFLLQDLKFGGTQRQTLELARRLDREKFQVEVWLLMAGDDLTPVAVNWGIPLVWLSRRDSVGPASLLQLWRRLRGNSIDLMMLLTAVPNIWGKLVGRLAGVPIIVSNCRGGAPQRQHEAWLWPLAHHIICNSLAEAEILTGSYGIPADRVTVILNGVDQEFFQSPRGAPSGPPMILSVGRLEPAKDQKTLIEAFRLVAADHPEAQLRLVGNGSRREELISLVARYDLAGRVQVLRGRPNLRPLFQEATVFALSSLEEGLPNVVLEAMVAGLPVVATRVGGLPEVVRPGRTGWLVPPGDVPALAAALSHLLSDPETSQAFGRAGREQAARDFSLASMVRSHEEIFMSLVKSRSGRDRRSGGE
ncbi:MAG: glycosyltransferase [Deltaproteobacteria bacterium]|nr:glycosyltransferase [Deltaproteobacteria bacterium]